MDAVLDALASGKAAVIPTDTVFGLAALPGSVGYEDIFKIKERPRDQVLPWLVTGKEALFDLSAGAPGYAFALADMFWPGALTLVVKASSLATGLGEVAQDGSIALRCPDDRYVLHLLEELDSPLACTSANRHGEPDARLAGDLPAEIRLLPGADALPDAPREPFSSTIVDCTGAYPVILREGLIPGQVILDVAIYGATLSDCL